jgi:quercetin dioxygenase-like cupin family protein
VDAERITFLGRPLGPSFRRRVVTLGPGARHPYDDVEWRDALVVVETGEVVLECRGGVRRTFATGNVIWLTGMGVLVLHNAGAEDAVLVAVSRTRPGSS